MNREDNIKAKIEKLQRQLAEIESGTFELYPGESFHPKQPEQVQKIILHMSPITRICFHYDSIVFWGSEECFTLNIAPKEGNQDFELEVRR